MGDLTWKFLYVTYNCGDSSQNWVRSINPTAGTEGDNTVTVDVAAATSPSDCLSATISISASTGEIQTIGVERCKVSCPTCSSFGISITSEIFPTTGKTGAELGSYTTTATDCMRVTSSSSALSNIRLNNGRIYGDVAENNGSDRVFRIDVYDSDGNICGNYDLRQLGAGSCGNASCNDIVVTFVGGETEKTDLPASGGTYSLNIDYNRNCWEAQKPTASSDGVSVDLTRKTITIIPSGPSDRNITVTFKFVNISTGAVCTKSLRITQEGAPVCNCESLTVTPTMANIAAEGGNALQIATYSVDDVCTISTISAILTEGNSFVSSINASDGNITANFLENTDKEPRIFEYELKIKYEGGSETYTCTGGDVSCSINGSDVLECEGTSNYSVVSYGYGGVQAGAEPGPEPEPCDGWSMTLNGDPYQYYYQDYEGSGGTPVNFFVKDGSSAAVGDLTTNDFEVIIDDTYQELFTCFEIAKSDPAPQAPYLLYLTKAGIDTVCQYIGEPIGMELRLKDCPDVKVNFTVIIGEVDNWNVKIDGAKSDQNSIYFGFWAHVKVGNCNKFVHMGETQASRKNPDDGNLYATLKIYRSINWNDEINIVLANTGGSYCQSPDCAKITSHNYNDLLVHYCPDGPCS